MASVDFSTHAVNPTAAGQSASAASVAAGASTDPDDSFTFDDALDIVNPLQHLPVISTLYQHFSGDTIKTLPKIAGDALYGGWMGLAGSVADTIFEKITGKSFGETALATAEDILDPSDATTGVADNAAAPADVPVADAAPLKPVQAAALAPIDTTAASVASNAPALPPPSSVLPASLHAIVMPGQEALITALSPNEAGMDTARRAVDAYRRTADVTSAAANAALQEPALRSSILQ